MPTIYNTHTHLLIADHIPDKFLPLGLIRLLSKHTFTRFFARVMHSLNPFSRTDIFDRYLNFLIQGNKAFPDEVLKNLISFYPTDSKFVVLTMDMDFMEAGIPRLNFEEQLKQISMVRKQHPNLVLPFIAADPRRKDFLNLVKHYIEKELFKGIKLYPALGFYPCDDRLNLLYEYAEKYQIPVITHAARSGIFYRGRISAADLIHPRSGEVFKLSANKTFTDNYSNPTNYHWILKDFPELRLCLAHFGGWSEWEKYILEPDAANNGNWFAEIKNIIRTYKNAYTDIAYTLAKPEFVPLLKETLLTDDLRSKVLFGSDFYLVNIADSEEWYSKNLPQILGEMYFSQLAHYNPKRFLNIK